MYRDKNGQCKLIWRETGVLTRANNFFWAFGVVVVSVVLGFDYVIGTGNKRGKVWSVAGC